MTCPSCKKKMDVKKALASKIDGVRTFPFCSQRCRQIDLGAWIDEDYRIDSGPHYESQSEERW